MNRLDTKSRSQIVAALVEGVGIRGTCRLTGCSKGAVTKLIADLGPVCEAFLDHACAKLPLCRTLEVDEIWAFILKKQKRIRPDEPGRFGYAGDAYTFTALCADTKLIPTWLVAPRQRETAIAFLADLASRLTDRAQITTDGASIYTDAVDHVLGAAVDYAQLVKLYGAPAEGRRHYSPAQCIGAFRQIINGHPDPERISTSYVERSNLTIRMGLRRFTRLRNGHSKKLENHCAALAIFFAHYNLVRVHQTLKCPPAIAAGLTEKAWRVADLVELLERAEAGEAPLGETRHDYGSRSVTPN